MEPESRLRAWSTAFVIAFFTAALLILPYIIGHLNAPEGRVFTGLLINLEDGTYLSAIEQGRSGSWLYQSRFTVETHEPVFLEGFYLMLGQVGRLLNLSTVTMWHVGQFGANFILFLTIFGFISLFLQSNKLRFSAYFLALFGAGFDWWEFPAWFERQAAFEVVPIDLKFPEAHVFYSALTFPHFVAGITLILLAFGLTIYLLGLAEGDNKRWLMAVGAGMANLLLGVVYPFLIYLTAFVLVSYYLYLLWGRFQEIRITNIPFSWRRHLNWTEIGMMAIVFMIPLPLYIYYAIVFFENPVLQAWNEQAFTPSPNPVHYLLTYGLYLFLGVLYPLKLRRESACRSAQKEDGIIQQTVMVDDNLTGTVHFQMKTAFLWIWLGAAAVLLYLPLNSQRRFVEGLQVPLAILAIIGFYSVVWPWILKRRFMTALLKRPRYNPAGMQRLIMLALIGLAGLSNIYLYSSTLIELGVERPYPLFRPLAEFEAMAWLGEQIEPGEVVLTSYRTGSFLPYRTDATVIVGNRYETGDFQRKREEAAQFFEPETTEQWRQELLTRYNVRYVFVGLEEMRLGWENILGAEFLEPAYQNGEVIIYAVRETQRPAK